MASPLCEDTAPSASLDCLEARAAPSHPGAPPEQLGGWPWPQEPASGWPKVEEVPLCTDRNVSKSEEGGWTFLRINFVAPGPSVGMAQLPAEAADAQHWVRELTLKAKAAPLVEEPVGPE